MAKTSRGLILLVLGAVIVVGCLGADVLGLGSSQGVGWKQLAGSAAGAVIGVVGVICLIGAGRAR